MRPLTLLTPGPTPLPPQVREALARNILHHRTAQYRQIFRRTLEGMQTVLQTSQPVICLTSSGTGAMEAAVVNLLSPGDEAVVVLGGKFGERWQHLCRAYGITAHPVPVAYGEAVEPGQVAAALAAHPKAKAVFATLCETSTGVVHPVQELATVLRGRFVPLVVDAISGLLADACRTETWGIDVLVSGSQKGLMLPPGLAFLTLSPRAWELVERSSLPRFYFDLRLAKKALADDDTPFTPGIAQVVALEEALRLILALGVDQMVERFARMAQGTRAAVEAMGLGLFAKRPSNGVTAIKVPEGVDGKTLVKLMHERSGVMVAGGQGEMAGQIIRIAHMGAITPEDVLAGLSALEDALGVLGRPVPAGAGPKAAKDVFSQLASATSR